MTSHAPRYDRPTELAWTGDRHRVALLDLNHLDRAPYILEGSSAVIWHVLGDVADEETVVEQVAAVYAVAQAEVRSSVRMFLTELHDRGLIDVRDRDG
jgi:hypothetical protein